MNASIKYQVNWTETDKILLTDRPPRPTDRPTDRQTDSSIPPTNFICRGIISKKSTLTRTEH